MARQWFVATNATTDDLLNAFEKVFFVRPTFKERFKLSKGAQLRSQQVWEQASAEGADVAAILASGGFREAIQDSKRGPGSGLGTTVAMSVSQDADRSVGHLWLAGYNTFLGINAQSDVIKAYSKLIATKLTDSGFSSEVGKV